MWKQYLYTQRKQLGLRRFIEENRTGGASLHTDLQEVHWTAQQCLGSPIDDAVYIAGALGQASTALGSIAGMDIDEKNDTGDNVVQRYYISREKQTVHYKNMSLIPAFLTVYEIVAKQRIHEDESGLQDCRAKIMNDLMNGWKDYMQTGTATDISKPGDSMITYNVGDIAGIVFSKFLSPTQSRKFRMYWKIVKKKMFKLNPGDNVFWNLKGRNHIYDPFLQDEDVGATNQLQTIARKGITRVLISKVHGDIVADTTDPAIMGFGGVSVCVDTIRSAQVLPLQYSETQISHKLTLEDKDNLASAVAPGEHADAADE